MYFYNIMTMKRILLVLVAIIMACVCTIIICLSYQNWPVRVHKDYLDRTIVETDLNMTIGICFCLIGMMLGLILFFGSIRQIIREWLSK